MEEDEDDLYGAAPAANGHSDAPANQTNGADVLMKHEEDEEEAEVDDDDDEDDDSESDIDIITERKDAPAAPSQDFKRVKQEPVRISSGSEPAPSRAQQSTPLRTDAPAQGAKLSIRDGSKYPEFRSSTLDINNIPMYDPAGKPITEVDLDADIAMETKPWRVPGTDPTDFFNYGFDEFTWVQYCLKQNTMKESVAGLKNDTKQFEAMLSGQPQQNMGGMPSMPGMPDMGPDMMNAMFSTMQAQGISDPSQLDFNSFMQQMQQMGGGMPGMPGMPGGFGQNQQHGQGNFSGGQGYGGGTPQPQQQGMQQPQNYDGFSPQQIAMLQQQQGGGGGGGGGGRGRGRGRRWN
ncbi:Fip1-domain-containing protein [Myriangium duriaei CBS 260.36]|uniref:Fip1-domain-containing protein n=1 Tax=Myriangium duriaei CBS 260.36 TaxID=1168546 RepID=A0A9P4J0I5_9PEZI|nr:Fip1-domain-containing protein [Myriangium duriaei CBS 260.36]